MKKTDFDVVIIGGGVTGCAIARALSAYALSVCLLEKCEDVCSGTSKANSAIVHAGFDALPGTWKAKMNIEGSRMMPQLAKDLDFRFKNNGSLVLCFDEADRPKLEELLQRGVKNGVEDLCIIERSELLMLEPNISDQAVAALYAPTGGIVCPFDLTVALAENAAANGAEFRFGTKVEKIIRTQSGFSVETNNGGFAAKCIVNAAGVYADTIHNMVCESRIHINPRKGDYCLMDKGTGALVSRTIFQLPGKYGKGILVTPTVHGNLLIGPTATDIDSREDTSTTAEDLSAVIEKSALSVKGIPYRQTITSFSGIRAREDNDDFILGESDCPGFFDAAGIDSPGLSSAPAIGKFIADRIAEKLHAEERNDFIRTRKSIPHLSELPFDERAALIRENPLYGRIICRCEGISEGEILDAIHRKPGAVSLDGVKRRVRAGMGRCQGGFCSPKVMEILARELHTEMTRICKNSAGSEMLTAKMGDEQ